MASPISVRDINLEPLPGQEYWNCDREWREEFIYFLMVDRFHDSQKRSPRPGRGRSPGFGHQAELRKTYGGTLRGIMDNLGYIKNLGCTALWLSPIFENNEASYHGYAIQNFLDIDPRFGTKQDLVGLVAKAHALEMRVFLDVVLNHSGDNWSYLDEKICYYDNGRIYPFGAFRRQDRPIPVELRNPEYYNRRGQITNWDSIRETQDGDFFSLKGFNNDDDPAGLELQEIMIKCHQYWMREADIDGFRMDAVKHMGELAVARFCSSIREYAYRLGKRWFLLFGELIGGDESGDRYIGPNTPARVGEKTVYFGLNSVLDFPLHHILPEVIKGLRSPADLIYRYEALRNHALNRGELGRYLITFLDNHDQVGMEPKQRFGTGAFDKQVIAGAGYLICALGTPCIYYGTEQGFSGSGPGDECIREAMFDRHGTDNALNADSEIYREIGAIARVNRKYEALRFGRMYFREISGNAVDFGLPQSHPCTLAFSRILADQEVLVAYNTSPTEARTDCIFVDSAIHKDRPEMHFVYGDQGSVQVSAHERPGSHARFVRLTLKPMQFVILV